MNLPSQSPFFSSELVHRRAHNLASGSQNSRKLLMLSTLLSFFIMGLVLAQGQQTQQSSTPQPNFLEELSPQPVSPATPSPPATPSIPANENTEGQTTNQNEANPAPNAHQQAQPQAREQQEIKIELDANSPLLRAPRPAAIAREPRATYLADFLSPQARILLNTTAETPVYENSQANYALDTIRAGTEVELLGFTQHGLLVRAQSSRGQGFTLGWIGKRAAADLQPQLLTQLSLMQQRQLFVAQLIEENEVALGMTPEEVRESLGRPDQETLRQTINGVSGLYSWVETRRIPVYETIQDRQTGQLFRRIVAYDTIETSRTDIEFDRGIVSAIESSKDRRRNRNLPTQISPPLLITW